MRRESWAIANTFAYAVRVLNCIFCRHDREEGWTEDDVEANEETHWLIAEQINSMCSDMMIDDAKNMLVMVQSIPTGRLCERIDCRFHHPAYPHQSSYVDATAKICSECVENQKSKVKMSSRKNHYDGKNEK